jgi:hypothetical protein
LAEEQMKGYVLGWRICTAEKYIPEKLQSLEDAKELNHPQRLELKNQQSYASSELRRKGQVSQFVFFSLQLCHGYITNKG